MKRILLFVTTVCMAIMTGCTGTPTPNQPEVAEAVDSTVTEEHSSYEMELIGENLSYSKCIECTIEDEYRKMNIYGPEGVDFDNRRPVVMFTSGATETPLVEFAKAFVANGYFVASPRCSNLRADKENDHSIKALRTSVEDLADALSYTKERAHKYPVDTTNIFLAGYTSGANLVTAFTYSNGISDKVSLDNIRGVIAISGTGINLQEFEKDVVHEIPCLVIYSETSDEKIIKESKYLIRQLGTLATEAVLTKEECEQYNECGTMSDLVMTRIRNLFSDFIKENSKK